MCRGKLRARKQYISHGAVQYFLVLSRRRALPEISDALPRCSSAARQAVEFSYIWSQGGPQNDGRMMLEKKSRSEARQGQNRSQCCRYKDKILSHVWFLCALFVCSFSLTRMAQGFLCCHRLVATPSQATAFPFHIGCALGDACERAQRSLIQFGFCRTGK